MSRFLKTAVPGLALVGASSPALAAATGPDFSSMTGAIDFTTLFAAILAVGTLMIGIAVVSAGVRKIYRMVKGA